MTINLSYVRIIPREVVNQMRLKNTDRAYIAGFLDGDGSIHVKLKPSNDYRFRFQIAPYIVFYQGQKEIKFLKYLKELVGEGYIRERNDGIAELIIGNVEGIRETIKMVKPFLRLKKKQAELMDEILSFKEGVKTSEQFLELARKIDKFESLNYSKKRINNSQSVRSTLIKEGLLTP